MSADWLVVVPAWGDRCVGLFVDVVLPAIRASLREAGAKARFLVHSDQHSRINAALWDFPRKVRELPRLNFKPKKVNHFIFGAAHQEAIGEARTGEKVALINADMVPSIECFAVANRRFQEGKRLIVCAANRTTATQYPPCGARARDLLGWVWANPHNWTEDCVWGQGKTMAPALLHFVRDEDVVTRGFHLHPFAFVKDGRPFVFNGPTADDGLATLFTHDEIHVVTDADEMAFAEMSPAERHMYSQEHVLTVDDVVSWAVGQPGSRPGPRTSPTHRWFFEHRIVIMGRGQVDLGDAAVCNEILGRLEASSGA